MAQTKTIALVHPGEMGSGIGTVLRKNGHKVLYASEGRSHETSIRAMRAGLLDVKSLDKLASADVVLSICPPHAALEVAASFSGFTGTYIDANAISPEAADEVRLHVESSGGTYVDGGIIGLQPYLPGRTTIYLSGSAAGEVAPLFSSEHLKVTVLDGGPTAASALKMAYASWSKGSAALLLATRALANSYGVEAALLAEWNGGDVDSVTESEQAVRLRSAASSATTKGWRWVAEMEEIARTYRSAGLPGGFHDGAAEIFRRVPFDAAGRADNATLEAVITALAAESGAELPR